MEIRPFHRSNSKLEMLSSTIKSTHNICMNFWELFKWKVLHIYNFFCFPTVVWQLIDMIDEIYYKRIEHKNGYHLKTLRNRTCLMTIISECNSQFWYNVMSWVSRIRDILVDNYRCKNITTIKKINKISVLQLLKLLSLRQDSHFTFVKFFH